MASGSGGLKLGREDYKKKKELEELRKLGAAPAEVDDDGFIINPHIPQYMAEAPWYISDGRPGLSHQRIQAKIDDTVGLGFIPKKGLKSTRKRRWKKGSCENCGSSTHKRKDCCERPRKRKAKHTNMDICADEYIPKEVNQSWDGKRDRWNGYDIASYQEVIDRHAKIEKYRRHKKAAELDQAVLDGDEKAKKTLRKKLRKVKRHQSEGSSSDSDSDSDSDDSDSDDDMRDMGQVIQRFDSKKRQTVRNLRIREDLPKYLRNLSVDSAYYDPKTRSMRANPYEGTDRADDELYLGDNFVRDSGDASKFRNLDKFCWDARNTNETSGLHLQAIPTMTEKAFEQFNDKRSGVHSKFNKDILAKYGGEEHFNTPDERLLHGQSEAYQEFAPDGRVVKGLAQFVAKSKYQEDRHPNGHQTVWGSWYDLESKKWGYACCHVTVFRGVCTGDVASVQADEKSRSDKKDREQAKKVYGVTMPPRELGATSKKKNPSGYISTKGIMASKGIARKEAAAKKRELENAQLPPAKRQRT